MKLTHFDSGGKAHMVDVSEKQVTLREAVARAEVLMKPETLKIIEEGTAAKGDVLGVARVAGIMAVKETCRIIPMAHPLYITGVRVRFRLRHPDAVEIEVRVKTEGKTGVEMEALAGACAAALTIYDMCKAVDRGMVISGVRLVEKTGGKSGRFSRPGEEDWDD